MRPPYTLRSPLVSSPALLSMAESQTRCVRVAKRQLDASPTTSPSAITLRNSYNPSWSKRISANTLAHWFVIVTRDASNSNEMEMYEIYTNDLKKVKIRASIVYGDSDMGKLVLSNPVVGYTTMEFQDIAATCKAIVEDDFGPYNLVTNNCQHFVLRLINRLCPDHIYRWSDIALSNDTNSRLVP